MTLADRARPEPVVVAEITVRVLELAFLGVSGQLVCLRSRLTIFPRPCLQDMGVDWDGRHLTKRL